MTRTATAAALPRIDHAAFAGDVTKLRAELEASLGLADFEHLLGVERWE